MVTKWTKKNPARSKLLIPLGRFLNIYAEGGTRTRTAFWARGFSYHYSFHYLPPHSSLFEVDSLWSGRCLLRACFITWLF